MITPENMARVKTLLDTHMYKLTQDERVLQSTVRLLSAQRSCPLCGAMHSLYDAAPADYDPFSPPQNKDPELYCPTCGSRIDTVLTNDEFVWGFVA